VAFALILGLGIGFVSQKFLGEKDVQFSTRPGANANNFNIYVKQVDVGTPVRFATDPTIHRSPTLSPDGRDIAFLRQFADSTGFCLVPALSGAEATDADPNPYLKGAIEGRSLAWSPDGKFLAVINKSSPQDPFSLFLLSLESGEQSKLNTHLATSARR
jgi:Tol biopolymer transport system component